MLAVAGLSRPETCLGLRALMANLYRAAPQGAPRDAPYHDATG
jgi:hypothetical protein